MNNINRIIIASLAVAANSLGMMAQQMTDATEHSRYIFAVDEYRPAPGQFVNVMPEATEGDTHETMAQKCTECLANNNQEMISLGGYGGYVTFRFDHSVANVKGSKDLLILGNAIQAAGHKDMKGGSSEAGIVMVSKDVNGNGLADDPWYELSGSCDVDSVGKVIYGYSITYTKAAMQDIPWTDNQGLDGTVTRNSFHQQEYFPLWLGSELTFTGTLLPKNAVLIGNSEWFMYSFREGYVDNVPNSDTDGNSFDLSWAVDPLTREPADLDFVDFVRVYNGMNQTCGFLGETSTEVLTAEDLHLDESIHAIEDYISGINSIKESELTSRVFDLSGRVAGQGQRGVYVVSDGKTVRKYIK